MYSLQGNVDIVLANLRFRLHQTVRFFPSQLNDSHLFVNTDQQITVNCYM